MEQYISKEFPDGASVEAALLRAKAGGAIDIALSNKLGGIESADYPGCYYRMVDGVVEWFNPPLQLGQEYRTTERYQGKPVYTKACGPVHGTATASNKLSLVNTFNILYSVQETIVECKCLIGTYSDGKLVNAVDNETFYNSDSLYVRRTGMDNGYVRLEFLGFSGEIGFVAKIKYTKSTD